MQKEELMEFLNRDIESLRSLNFSETYIKSVIENTSKWAKTGLLGGIKDSHIGRTISTLLENQRLLNEQWPDKGASLMPEGAETDVPIDIWATQWRRISIPVLRRAFGMGFIGNQIVSVQALKSPQENTYLIGFDGRTTPYMIESATRRLPLEWERPAYEYDEETGRVNWAEFQGFKSPNVLDVEAEATAAFAENICNAFSQEIIRDLANNAGKSAQFEYKDEKHLLSLIEGMSSYIGAKCQNRDATWVITSPTIVKLLGEYIEPETVNIDDERKGINLVGTLDKRWRLFEDASAPSGNILMGLKDHRTHYFSGYIFAPFLPVNPIPAWKNEKHEQQGQVLARYGKRMTNPGFYGALKIENLPEATPLEMKPEQTESEE